MKQVDNRILTDVEIDKLEKDDPGKSRDKLNNWFKKTKTLLSDNKELKNVIKRNEKLEKEISKKYIYVGSSSSSSREQSPIRKPVKKPIVISSSSSSREYSPIKKNLKGKSKFDYSSDSE